MKTARSFLTLLLLMIADSGVAGAPLTLVLHGGAGITRAELSAEREQAMRKVLEEALRAGFTVLREGGSSTDAVTASVVLLENSPLFNAGRGSVLTSAGTVEMDASIMEGAGLRAGAAACVRGVKNPVLLARSIMQGGRHVMLAGEGAEHFARSQMLAFEPPEYFLTPERRAQLERFMEKERGRKSGAAAAPPAPAELMGTVGALALDGQGRLAAATSTGGRTGKHPGRVGDSPVIGAGTWAEDGVVAVSCTGHGEYFMRLAVAHAVAAKMKYQGATVAAAAQEIIHGEMPKLGGTGGLIALDAKGNLTAPFNTEGMFRAWMQADGQVHVAVFKE
jgi:isoaspartyl peptidase/L-asparaginase-like protein (Ntn-hydrolase superfamily)